MTPSRKSPLGSPWFLVLAGIIILSCILAVSSLFGGTTGNCRLTSCDCPVEADHVPVFPDPSEKLSEISDPNYTKQLFVEAVAYEPLLVTPGTQVHMGFYSAKGNHGSLLRLLDSINDGPAATANPPNRAIWAQGVNGFYPFPSWERVMDEHWYERASAVNGTVTIFGESFQDPYPVTFAQADAIWAQYSSRFTEMAEPIAGATGRPVKAWCFVEGAKSTRIFYNYEFAVLRKLEEKGLVEVYFAKTQQSEWDNPADWLNGTVNVPIKAV